MKVFAKNNNTTNSTHASQSRSADPFFGVQAKLAVGKPDDKYEKEADAMADKVVQKSEAPTPFFGNGNFFPPASNTLTKTSEEDLQKKEDVEEIQEKPLVETITPVVQLASEEEEIQPKCSACEAKDEQIQKMPFEEVQQKTEPQEDQSLQKKCSSCGGDIEAVQKKEANVFPPLPEGVIEETEEKKAEIEALEKPKEEAVSSEEKAPEDKKSATGDLKPPVREEKEPIAMPVQEKSNGQASQEDISETLSDSKGNGSSLDNGTLQEMNSGFGTDFSDVNIHTGGEAVKMNQSLGAQAFTSGNDIYFNEGKYDPSSNQGKHLLAHELTHTVQQGENDETVQRFVAPEKKASPEGKPEKPNDGTVVEGKSNAKIDGDENVKNQDDLSAEEKKEKKDPPRGEVRSEKSSVQAEGVSTPPVDRGGEAQTKITEQKQQMDEQLSAEPAGGEGEATNAEGEAQEGNVGEAQTAEQRAQALLDKANNTPVPEKPAPFKHPNVIAPIDSAGQPIARKANIDTQVRGLGYIGELLREKGYEIKQAASEKEIHADGLEASLETSKKDLALSKEGTQKFEDQNTERKTISETSKKALDESKSRQSFVAGAAPGLAQEADTGKAESGSLAADSKAKAGESKSKIPDDEDAKADAEKQSGEMEETSSGAQSMDEAITQTGERARQYIKDAEQASKDNSQSEAEITENDSIITQIDGKVASFKAMNAASNTSIAASSSGPNTIRKQAKGNRAKGDQLISATMAMEMELNALQDEYLAGMAAIESKETAQKRADKEAEEKKNKEASPEELKLYTIAALPEAEQEEHIQSLQPEEKQGIMTALDKMITEMPDDGTAETEGARKEVKLSSGESGPGDPRQPAIDAVDNKRIERVSGVMPIADNNMNLLTAEQQKMLAEKLMTESITDDIKNISVAQMAKGMIEGMINPMVGLQGVVGGLEKTFSGVANIFNADAWAKDPLGNLLQIGADISTGLAMVFSSILGIAGMITALMVALTIISWGTLTPVTAPVIGWMGTIMTYAGWGAIIAGSLSVYFNSLAYIKNLNDAGTAQTASELFGNVEQMKKNASDGMTGAMAIVEGVGAVKMGPVMKSGKFMQNVPKSPGAFARQTMDGVKDGLGAVAKMPSKIASGAKKLFSGGKKGLKSFKKKLQGFFSKSSKTDIDLPDAKQKKFQADDGVVNKGKTADGHEVKVDKDGNIAKCSECKVYELTHKDTLDANPELKAELAEIRQKMTKNPDSPEAMKELQALEVKLDQAKAKMTTAPKTSKKHREFEAEVDARLKNGDIDADTAKKLKEYSQSTKGGPSRNIDDVIKDIKGGKVLNPETSRFGDDGKKVKIDDAKRKKVEANRKAEGKNKTPAADSPEHKRLTEQKAASEKRIKDAEAEIDSLSNPENKSKEAKDYQDAKKESFEKKNPEVESRKKFNEDYDAFADGDVNSPEYIEKREAKFKEQRERKRTEHSKKYDRGQKNNKAGDAFEKSRTEQLNAELEESLGRPLKDGEGVRQRTPAEKETFDIDGETVKVSPDLEDAGPPITYIESKSGPLSLTPEVEDQIIRYAQLTQKTGRKVTYELLNGASENVISAFKKYGVDYIDFTKL